MKNTMPSGAKRAIAAFWIAPVILVTAIVAARLSGWINTGSAVMSVTGTLVLYLPFPWLLRLRINFIRLFTIALGGCLVMLVATVLVVDSINKGAIAIETLPDALLIYAIVGGFVSAAMLLVGKGSSDWFLDGAAPEKRDRQFWLKRAGAGLLAASVLFGGISLIGVFSENVKEQYLSGLADSSGTVILEPTYRELEIGSKPESIMACSGKGCGFIDRAGHYVIEPRFESARPFDESGLACVKPKDKWGCIDRTGQYVIPPTFDFIYSFANSRLAAAKMNGKWGYIDTKGKYVTEPTYTAALPFFYTGLAAVAIGDSKWGYINEDGKVVIEPAFNKVSAFSASGLAAVKVKGKWGYIDTTGKYAIAPVYVVAGLFDRAGMAAVQAGSKWGYIDRTGQWIIQPRFDHAHSFGDSDRASVRVGTKWGVIDRTGKFLIDPKFSWARSPGLSDSKGLAAAKDGDRGVGVIDHTGRYVIQPTYELIQFVPSANDSMLIIVTVIRWCLFETVCLP